MSECSLNGLKILCEKEKLLVTSNFSFSHSVFKRPVLQTRENQGLFGKGLIEDIKIPYHTFQSPKFPEKEGLRSIEGTGENADYKDTPTKKPRRSSAAQTQDPLTTSQTLYH